MLPETSEQITPAPKTNEISVYQKGGLTTKNIISQVKKLRAAFPQLPKAYYDILSQRIKANQFSDQRFDDAVNNLIDNCQYPTPTIANVISYDKKITLYTYSKVVEAVNYGRDMKDFKKLRDKKLWMELSDAEQYGLQHLLND